MFKLFSFISKKANLNHIKKKVFEDHDYCDVKMPVEVDKILKYIQAQNSIKTPFFM